MKQNSNLIWAFLTMLAIYLNSACENHGAKVVAKEQPQRTKVSVTGKIDEQLVQLLTGYDNQRIEVELSLTGGRVDAALKLGELAQRNDWSATVEGVCFSACAEIFLLGFKEITIAEQGIVGFHGNSMFKNQIYRIASGDQESDCFLQYEDRRKKLYAYSGANYDFWKRQWIALKPYAFRTTSDGSDCDKLYYKTEFEFWYPSTRELRDYYELDFKGEQFTDNKVVAETFYSMAELLHGSLLIGDAE